MVSRVLILHHYWLRAKTCRSQGYLLPWYQAETRVDINSIKLTLASYSCLYCFLRGAYTEFRTTWTYLKGPCRTSVSPRTLLFTSSSTPSFITSVPYRLYLGKANHIISDLNHSLTAKSMMNHQIDDSSCSLR